MKSKTTFTNKDIYVLLICIIFLLATLGAVSERGRKRAMETVCLANLHHWGNIYERYTSEHDGDLTPGTHYIDIHGNRGAWFIALSPYFGDNPNLMLCPCASRPMEHHTDSGTFRAWIFNYGGRIYTGSYNENSWTCSHEGEVGASITRPPDFYWRNVAGVKNKNNIPVLADGTHFDAWTRHYDEPPPYPDSAGIGNVPGIRENMWHFCIDRHNGGINMLFMDWSARKVGLKELWRFKWHRKWELGGPYGTEYDPSPWTTEGGVQPEDWPPWMRNFKDY